MRRGVMRCRDGGLLHRRQLDDDLRPQGLVCLRGRRAVVHEPRELRRIAVVLRDAGDERPHHGAVLGLGVPGLHALFERRGLRRRIVRSARAAERTHRVQPVRGQELRHGAALLREQRAVLHGRLQLLLPLIYI